MARGQKSEVSGRLRSIDAAMPPALPRVVVAMTRVRLLIKAHDLDPAHRCVLHVLLSNYATGITRTLERVTSDCPQRLFDFCSAVYPGIAILSAIKKQS